VTDHPIKIDTSASPPPTKKGFGCVLWFLAFVVFIMVGDLVAVLLPTLANRKAAPEKKAGNLPSVPLVEKASQGSPDQSHLQWISPTSGPPITLEYVPLGTQVVLHLRPAELMAHGEGDKLLAALGRWGEQAVARIEEATGAELSQIESLVAALVRVDDRWDCTLRATFSVPRTQALPHVAGRTIFLPAAGQGRVLISCPSALSAELKQQRDAPALLSRDLERLLPLTDQHRSVALLMPAKFLATGGRELLVDGGEGLVAAFDALIPDNASAILVSCDWRENFFCELAATIVQNAPAHRFNAEFANHLDAAEELLANSLSANPPPAYGKAIEERFPAMLRTMSDFTRVSRENGIALARCYLPVQAGHNLLLASRLRLSEDSQATKMPLPTQSLSNRLQQMTTLSFPKETLDNALEMLATDAKLPIQIAGRDLQLEGITKNQTFALDLHSRPAAEILVEVLRQANPDREAADARDPRQKLVYVIREDAIIVTTRAAAAQRGEELPEVFRGEQP
jgi:hypothetical protein